MTELEQKLKQIERSPRTFEDWVNDHSSEEKELIEEALFYATKSRKFQPLFNVISTLNDNPWTGQKDAVRNYAHRKYGA